jgi:hypothetical protein
MAASTAASTSVDEEVFFTEFRALENWVDLSKPISHEDVHSEWFKDVHPELEQDYWNERVREREAQRAAMEAGRLVSM